MRSRPRLGLLARVTAIYALGALLLTSIAAVSTFALAQRRLLTEFEERAQAQAIRNAVDLGPSLQFIIENPEEPETNEDGTEPANPIRTLLESTFRPNQAGVLVIPPDQQARSLAGLEIRDIPADLNELVINDQPAGRRYIDSNGEPQYAVGLRFPDLDIEYYEVAPLADLADTLSSLRIILVGVTIGSTLLGAVLGYYSARRALQPLTQVSMAAEAIADGDFTARLDPTLDPGLRPITQSFNEMVDALQARIERDERFASDVSHELRSPLMTLTASVEVLERRRAELPEPAQQAADLLKKDLRRFQRLVEDLLEISRMDVGAVQLDAGPIVLRDFLGFVVAQSNSPDVPVSHTRGLDRLVIIADKRRLAQAITNLLDNAAKYGGGATSVSYRQVGPDGELVQILVDDEGPGVEPAERERIFDRFTRAAGDAGRRETAKGVGLGLSLVTEHVRLHGGRIWVTDRSPGEPGARFVIEIPIGDAAILDEEMAV